MHWSSVHVHVGTTEVTARVSIARLGIRQIAPGASAYATLLLDRPIAALHGDRFILRDNSGQRTLGGGPRTGRSADAHDQGTAHARTAFIAMPWGLE